MAKISAIDFANNVDYNRKKLIEHCGKNGIKVDDNASLDVVVDANSNIIVEQNDKFKVEFLDIDCSEFALPQYVEKGGSATIPTEIPSFDSEYLEFIEWATPCDVGLDNVQFDMVCLPRYKTKYDETLGQRPTYLICCFDEDTLSPTLQIGSTHVNTYIDWGDGNAIEQVTANTLTHNYASAGIYTIKIYGDSYSLGGNTTAGVFTTVAYAYALLKAYVGENAKLGTYSLAKGTALRNVVISTDTIALSNYIMVASGIVSLVLPEVTGVGTYAFQMCSNLKYIIFSKNTMDKTLINTYGTFSNCNSLQKIVMDISFNYSSGTTYARTFSNCKSLTNVVLLEGVTTIGTYYFDGCTSLKNVKTPNSLQTIRASAFNTCSMLETIELHENVTTIEGAFAATSNLKSITIPKRVTTNISLHDSYNLEKFVYEPYNVNLTIQLSNCYNLKEIILPDDFDNNILIKSYSLSDNLLIYIFNKLKDNSITGSVRTLTLFSSYKTKLNTIYLNEFDEVVPYGTEGAISLLQKIQNKNWTVSFSAT